MTSRKTAFGRALADRNHDPTGRRWIYVPYDQLSGSIGPLAREDPAELGIVLVESPWKAGLRPYHRQKLVMVLACMRHFALEQAERGVAVRHVVAQGPYGPALRALVPELGPLRAMVPAERALRVDLGPLVEEGAVQLLPHEGWLTTVDQFRRSQKGSRWRMDAFYRLVRRETGILMEKGRPIGGKFSFDVENRRPWRGDPPAPSPPVFCPDEVTREAAELVERELARHPGTIDLEALPATADDAGALWRWALDECLPEFGPFEDAMSVRSTTIFHTRIAACMNLHRLLPSQVVADAVQRDLPLASKEGFVRQVLGWREFVRHVHESTDGLRRFPGAAAAPVASGPGDGGYEAWNGTPWNAGRNSGEGGAAPSALDAHQPLPPAFWGRTSGLACLDRVVASVWAESYSHHITRLMVLCNLATLLDVSPRELTDWFWVSYADAYDWVVEPNVLGMGTFALGDRMTTKPYVSGAAYIHRMSDYCSDCEFDPKKDCPITPLYWAFLERHRDVLEGNPRMSLALGGLRRRDPDRRRRDVLVFEHVRDALRGGERLTPGGMRGERTGVGGDEPTDGREGSKS